MPFRNVYRKSDSRRCYHRAKDVRPSSDNIASCHSNNDRFQSDRLYYRTEILFGQETSTILFDILVNDTVTLSLSDNPGPVSDDINFNPSQNYTQGLPGKEQTGQTKVVEDSQYQSTLSSVTAIYSEVSYPLRARHLKTHLIELEPISII